MFSLIEEESLSSLSKNYRKFDWNKLQNLKESYISNPYPSKEEMEVLSTSLNEKFSKIQNWFKYERRKEVKKGKMKYEKKNTFSKVESNFLLEQFLKNPYPTKLSYEELAKKLKCRIKNVKHWFTYKRKLILISKKTTKSAFLEGPIKKKTNSTQSTEEPVSAANKNYFQNLTQSPTFNTTGSIPFIVNQNAINPIIPFINQNHDDNIYKPQVPAMMIPNAGVPIYGVQNQLINQEIVSNYSNLLAQNWMNNQMNSIKNQQYINNLNALCFMRK